MAGERTASRLTPARIERLRYDPGRGGTQRLWDVVSPGLGVQVFASGRKSWLVRLRDGRFRTLGAVSAFGLDEARQRAAVTRETGEPPPLVAPEPEVPPEPERPAEAGTTVRKLWETYSTTPYFLSRSPDFRRGMASTMKVHVIPAFGDRPLSTLTRKEFREAINALIADGREGAARGLLNRLRILLNFAIEEELIEASPAEHIKPRFTTTGRRDAWIESAEGLRRAWWVDAPIQVRLMVRWCLATGCRRDEAREARRDHMGVDAWRLPVTKNGQPHALPLMALMRDILAESKATFGPSDWVFPATTSNFKAIPRDSFGYALRQATDGRWSAHVLRHTVESHMARLGVPEEARDAVLNHARAGVGRRYQHDERLELKREALAVWHGWLLDVVVAEV